MKQKFNADIGAGCAALLLTLLVILSEKIPAFKAGLVSVFTHHWIGKVVITIAAFIIIGFATTKTTSIAGMKAEKFSWYSVLLTIAIILIFFVVEGVA